MHVHVHVHLHLHLHLHGHVHVHVPVHVPVHVHVHVHGMRTARARPLQAWSPLGSGLLTRYLRDAPEAKQACVEVEP